MRSGRLVSWAWFLAPFLDTTSLAQARFADLHRMLPLDGDFTRGVALGDLDGDGDPDAVAAIHSGPERLYLNGGAGAFTDASSQLPTPSLQTATAVALGDVDGDGDLDAWFGSASPLGSRLFVNDGSAVFSDATAQLPSTGGDAQAVALGDLDADGDLDAWLGKGGGDDAPVGVQDRLYRNDGSGTFSDATAQLPVEFDATHGVALGDVDGDGDLDAMVANTASPSFVSPGALQRLFLNDGSGSFTNATSQLPAIPGYMQALALGDVEGDGDLDALIVGLPAFFVPPGPGRLYLNNGSGVFTDATAQLPAVGNVAYAVALGDADGDGDLDAVVGNSGQSRLLLNAGSGAFADATAQLPAAVATTRALSLGDMDGDGDLDLFLGNHGEQDRLYLNDGSGSFADATSQVPVPSPSVSALALGDVDGDGDLDALSNSSAAVGASARLYRNDGTGAFSEAAAQLPAVANSGAAIVLGDVDGDGDLDAVVGNTALPDRLYLNDGSGAFTDATAQLPAFLEPTGDVALGDMDGDGDLDAYVGNAAMPPGAQNRLYVNDGTGVFSDASGQLPAFLDLTSDVALGDVDADGDLDVLIGNGGIWLGGQQDRLCLNDGTGTFSEATAQLPAVLDMTLAVALGDLDGDGDLDALVGNHLEPNRLYLNTGSGVFADATAQIPFPAFAQSTTAIALGDVDEDGDLDALAGVSWQEILYLNNGSAVFSDATNELPAFPDATVDLVLGDVDGDGDLDALLGGAPNRVPLSNLTRQVAARGAPRIGKPLTLDLHGPPGGAWALGAATATASIPVGSVGTLRLDPAGVFAVFTGSLDALGRASITFGVPPNPALAGFSVYWQAMVATPLRLANLEVTTLTTF